MRRLISRALSILVALAVAIPVMAQADFAARARKAESLAQQKAPAMQAPARKAQVAQAKQIAPGKAQFSPFANRTAKPMTTRHYAPSFAAGATEIYGVAIYYDGMEAASDAGLYSISTQTPSVEAIHNGSDFYGLRGTYVDGSIVGVVLTEFWGYVFIDEYRIDVETGETTFYNSSNMDYSCIATDYAYDPTTGNIYGTFFDEELTGEYHFGVLDTSSDNWSSSVIAIVDAPLCVIACDKNGNLYGIDDDGSFVSVDKYTGEYTVISEINMYSQYTASACIDDATGTFYYDWQRSDDTSALVAINIATGEANVLYDFPNSDEFTCLYIPAPAAEDGAPAAVTNLVANFAEGALTGTVTFTAPDTNFDGSAPAAGAVLNYTVKANGAEVASGTCAYGEEVSAEITLAAAGNTTIEVRVSNATGDSPSATYKAFFGVDTPKAVTNVELTWDNGQMTLTWNPTAGGVYGGYIGDVTYTVKNGDTVIAEGLTACTYTGALPEPSSMVVYCFDVYAVNAAGTSAAASSNRLALGEIKAPFTETFAADGDQASWTIIDANGDGKKWMWNSGSMRMSYNTSENMDDWLITPPVTLEGGKLYTITVTAHSQSTYYAERFEVCAGTAATVAAMTTQVIAPTEVGVTAETPYEGQFIAKTGGQYFFGIHGISDPDMYYLNIDEFAIDGGSSALVPGQVTNFVVEPDANGALTATIKFNAPAVNAIDDAITSLTKVELYAGEELINTFDAPAVGAALTYEYTAEADGAYTFTAIAYNEEGAGIKAEASAYIGVPIPGAPASASVVEVAPGVVNISWTAPETDIDGNPMNPAFCTYTVVGEEGIIAEGLTDLFYNNYTAVEEGQDFVYFDIYASTSAGMNQSEYASTNMIACGTPFTMPYIENFADATLTYPMAMQVLSGSATAGISNDEYFSDLTSRNNDNGFIFIKGTALYDALDLFTGKINVSGNAPELSFYWLSLGDDDENVLNVDIECDGEFESALSIECIGELGEWHKATCSLSDYVGKTIQVHFVGTIYAYTYIIFDDIRIEDPMDHNLAAGTITAPAKVNVAQDLTIGYTVENQGIETAEGYTVSLYIDGEIAQTAEELPAIEAGKSYTGAFTHGFNALQAGTHQVSFYVNYAADMDDTNNESRVIEITVNETNYPTVELTGEIDAETAYPLLSWDTPSLDATPVTIVEDFESEDYESFTIENFGQWTLKCLNTGITYGISGQQFPNDHEVFGWILFDYASLGFSGAWDSSDGSDRYMAAFAHENGAPNDAFLISPALPGVQQTITFEAKSLNDQYGLEEMKAYYSTTDTEISSFIEVEINGYNGATTTEWTEYSIDVPEGAKYFAIESTSADIWVLMLDNISYIGMSEFGALEILGYNIYRNGEKINDTVVVGNTYLDTEAPDGTNKYNVSVVYAQGESKVSNTVNVLTSAISSAKVGAQVRVEGHTIIVENAADVAISAADGKVMRSAKGEAKVTAEVPAGVYMVKTNDKVVKVVVK